MPLIVEAGAAGVLPVARLIAEAFRSLRASEWLVPDPEHRQAAMAGQFAILIEHALDCGQVDVLADGTGAAVWFHREGPFRPPHDYDERLASVCGAYTNRFQALDELFETHHPAEPHHHLAMLAVHPRHQGTGRGTLLLRHHQRVLDEQHLPAYLEAAGFHNVNLYSHEGYRLSATPFALPNDAYFYPMWRDPRPWNRSASHAAGLA
ncbi:MAG: GNAT family N-acetyltransferase, partial [Micromonosporaceae bacterium]|nr:GNAT family N-acetyltransferase [Micromonosporaceae bacterium]